MIQINLVDYTTSMKHITFLVVPVTNDKEFTCFPDGILPLGDVVQLSQKVKSGRVYGSMGKYLWYRLKVMPAGKPKSQMGGQQRKHHTTPPPDPSEQATSHNGLTG